MLHRQAFMCRQIPTSNDPNIAPNFYIVWGRSIVRGYPDRVILEEYSDYDEKWTAKVLEYFPQVLPEQLNNAIVENFKKFDQMGYRF